MMIHNPKNGATIRDMWIFDKLYFSEKTQEEFKPEDVIDVEDKVGEFLLHQCGFLVKVTPAEAKKIIEERGMRKFVCDKCGFEAKAEIGLIAHKRSHESIVEGVRVVKPVDEQVKELKEEVDQQKQVDAEARGAGLIGDGLTVE